MHALRLRGPVDAKLLLAALFVLTALTYGVIAGSLLQNGSIAPYFVDLADALLDGKLYIEHPSNAGYDMIDYGDHWYVAQPPLPAVVALPFVAVMGRDATPDVLIGVLCGALSVTLCGLALRRSSPDLSLTRWLAVVLLYAFGTVQVSLSVMGTVWYLGQVAAALCLWAMILSVQAQRPLLAGLFAGLIVLSRPTVIIACVVFALGYWLLDQGDRFDWTALRNSALRLTAGILPSLLLLGAYNLARFGSALDSGYDYIVESAFALQRRRSLGVFNLAFLPENFYIAFLKPLKFEPRCFQDTYCGIIATDLRGAGMLWTSPAVLLYAVIARARTRTETYRYLLYAAAALLALAPGLLYHNTGEAQFGYRFALDALPFAMLLVAAGARRGPWWLLWGLMAVCALINIWGAKWLMHMIV